jgi:hypothetical protein
MPYKVEKIKSSKFREYSPFLCLGINIFLLLTLILSNFLTKTLLNRTVSTTVTEGKTIAKLEPIVFKPSLIGALRIDARAIIQNNSWLTYEIQLQDEQGNIVASAVKPAWKESGTWREGGESGSWQEQDLRGGIDLRLHRNQQQQTLTPIIQVLEYTDTSGKPRTQGMRGSENIYQNVSFKVKIIQGAIDSRYLWAGLVGTAFMTLFCFWSVNTTGKLVIKKKVDDSDIGDWAVFGAPNQLVEITVEVLADETSPQSLQINLWLNDGFGEQCCHLHEPIKMIYRRNDDKEIVSAQGKQNFYFLLPKRESYNVYLEVVPDQPVEKTWLSVKQGVKTLRNLEEINQISYSEI